MPKPFATVTAFALALATLPLNAADSPAKAIPGDAAVVLRFGAPDKTLDKVAALANQFNPQAGFAVAFAKASLGQLISNPAQTGVDKTKDWWVAVYPKPEGEPTLIFAVPASDMAAMKGALAKNLNTAEHDNWLLYSPSADAVASVKKTLGDEKSSLSGKIQKGANTTLQGGDLAVYVNLAQLKVTYKTQIEDAREEIEQGLDQLENFAVPIEGLDVGAIFKFYARLARGLFQGAEDSTSFAANLGISNDAITIEEVLMVGGKTETAKFFASQPTDALAAIGQLPNDQVAYAGFHGDMAGMAKIGMELYSNMIQDAGAKAKLAAAAKDLEKIQYGAYVGSMATGDAETGAIRATVMADLKSDADIKAISRKMYKSMTDFSLPGVTQKTTVEEDAEKYGDETADLITVTQEVDEQFDPFGIQSKLMEVMYGPDGMKTRVVYRDGSTVSTIGGGRKQLEEALAAADRKANPATPQAQLRAKLLPKANAVILFDLATTIKEIVKIVAESGVLPAEVPLDAEVLDDVKFDKSYIGFSVGTEKNGVRAKTIIPVKQMKNLFDIGMAFRRMVQPPQL